MSGLCILLDMSTRTHHPFLCMFHHFCTGWADIYFFLSGAKTKRNKAFTKRLFCLHLSQVKEKLRVKLQAFT